MLAWKNGRQLKLPPSSCIYSADKVQGWTGDPPGYDRFLLKCDGTIVCPFLFNPTSGAVIIMATGPAALFRGQITSIMKGLCDARDED